jgi:hypothetical protein
MGDYHLELKNLNFNKGETIPVSVKLEKVKKGVIEFDLSYEHLK